MKLFLLLPLLILLQFSSTAKTKLVYGPDDRLESDSLRGTDLYPLTRSVAVMVHKRRMSPSNNYPDQLKFRKVSVQSAFGLCEEESFKDQYALGSCSGFLVGPDLIVTAGHCIEHVSDCSRYKWVFDYTYDRNTIYKESVYSCDKIHLWKEREGLLSFKDYAVIQLKRKVAGRTPLKTRRFGFPKKKTEVMIMGHPLGMPLKIAKGAFVAGMSREDRQKPLSTFIKHFFFFNTNTDSFVGNSGSPIINLETKKVEGILVEGDKDFVYDREEQCERTYAKSMNPLDAEERIMRITRIKKLKRLIKASFKKTSIKN